MTKDRHLNLFYSYNLSNQLIENNLTRAFIQTLRLLEGKNRNEFLKILFAGKCEELNYSDAQVALQDNIDEAIPKKAQKKYVITITGRALGREDDKPDQTQEQEGGSIPDAWIYKEGEYCLLIECKIGEGYDIKQIKNHITNWFDNKIDGRIDLAWDDVLWGIDRMKEKVDSKEITLNRQEQIVLDDLFEFMGYYGYSIFKGFDFDPIPEKPDFELIDIKEVKNGTDNE